MEKTRNTEEEKKMGQKWVKEEHKASTSRVNTGFPVNTGKLSPMMREYNFANSVDFRINTGVTTYL